MATGTAREIVLPGEHGDITIQDTPNAPEATMTLLKAHVPYSLPILRRFQFSRLRPGSITSTTHFLVAQYSAESLSQSNGSRDTHFAAAWVDLSRSPETEGYIYSTLEDHGHSIDPLAPTLALDQAETRRAESLVFALLRHVRRLAAEHPVPRPDYPGPYRFILGSVNEVLRQRLLAAHVRIEKTANVSPLGGWEFIGKWLFRVDEFPGEDKVMKELPRGMRWDMIKSEDVELVKAKTQIRRQAYVFFLLFFFFFFFLLSGFGFRDGNYPC
jgi:hypothetical protein